MKKITLFLSLILISPTMLLCMLEDEIPLASQEVQEIPEITDALANIHIDEPVVSLLRPSLRSGIDDKESKKPNHTSSAQKKRSLNPNNFHVVVDGELYRSGKLSSQDLEFYITKFGIKSVVNLRSEHNIAEKAAGSKASGPGKYDYYHVPMCSHCLPSIESLDYLVHIFKHAKKPILVHCEKGIDRSGEAAALYSYAIKKKSKQEALLQLSPYFGYRVKKHPGKAFLIYLLPEDPEKIPDWIQNTYNPYCYEWCKEIQQQFEQDYNLGLLYAPNAFLRDFKEGINLQRLDLVFADYPIQKAARQKALEPEVLDVLVFP